MFRSYANGNLRRVKMAMKGAIEVVGLGKVILVIDTSCKLVIKDVRHVPHV